MFYCLVCFVDFDMLFVVSVVLVRVKNHLYSNQLIGSLNLNEFKLHMP